MARATPGARGGGRTRARRSGNALDRFATFVHHLCSALNDPANRGAHFAVAAVLLAAEAALCLLIIRRVPCERRWDWQRSAAAAAALLLGTTLLPSPPLAAPLRCPGHRRH